MSTTASPNMNMPVPTVGVETGPAWANDINACLSIVDQHNHTAGYGVTIPPSGLNINAALTFQNNQATNLQATVYTAQASLTTLQAVYVKGVDLYYRDGSNNEIRITSGAAVNATSSGITSGTASASFVGSTLVVNAASLTPANIQCASILIGNNSASSHYLTISPPTALGADYTIVMPSLPASQKIVTLDASGNMSAPYTVDGSTIAVSANVIGIPAGGVGTTQLGSLSVTTAKIAAAAVTNEKLAALNYNLGSSSGAYTTSSSSYVSVPFLTATITTVGRPVLLMIQPDGTGNDGYVGVQAQSSGGNASISLEFRQDSSDVCVFTETFQMTDGGMLADDLVKVYAAPGRFTFLDTTASAGAHTWSVRVKLTAGTLVAINYCKLVAIEL